MDLTKQLQDICKTLTDVNLKEFCSIKIGGNAKYMCLPNSIKQLKKLITFLTENNIEYYFFGNGTNIVFLDKTYSIVLICLKHLTGVKINKNKVTVLAGTNMFTLNYVLKQNSICGLEWSYGIPGTIGGAAIMNAGAYGHEIGEFITSVWILDDGRIKKIENKNLQFYYRDSSLKQKKCLVVKVCLKLSFGQKEQIDLKQKEILKKRLESQPYTQPSCGSIFKKSENISAGKTIDKLGLKSVTIGGIQISPKHANFFVNVGNASSDDLIRMIKFVKKRVKESKNIDLVEEVIFVKEKEK